MRELHYENQGTNTYLVYAVDANDSVDSMSLGMLTNNRIHGLAQTIFTQMDNQKFIKFNVSAKVSVAQFFTGSVNKKRLLGVFTGIVNAMLEAEDYMLDPASIITDLDYIFTDVSTCETDLICLPIIDTEAKQTDLGMFFRNIMFTTQFDQTENCDHVAKIINYLNGTPLFSLNDFKKLLEDIQDQKAQPVVTKVKTDAVADSGQSKKQPVVNQTLTNQTTVFGQPADQPSKATTPQTNSVIAGMNVPPAQKQQNTTTASTPEVTEPKISFFYLMQHYNKENAELYKTQKAAKKSGQSKTVAKQPKNSAAFTVPGATGNSKFAVPGQPASMPVPTGNFAIPGQPTPPSVPKNGFAVSGQSSDNVPPKPNFAVPGQTPAQPAQKTVKQQAVIPKTPEPMVRQAQPIGQPTQSVVQSMQPAGNPYAQPQGQSMNFGETTVLGLANAGETTVLSANPGIAERKPHLLRKKNNEEVLVDKPVFRIGKERSYVDYFIGDNTAISRSHANIITRGEEYFVVDTNSTNHTYVNGVMLQSNAELKISHGDKIRFANEEFEFKLY